MGIRRLGVNIDHVATLRQARRSAYPDPVLAAMLAEQAGAAQITCHIRGDRRHVNERDIRLLREVVTTQLQALNIGTKIVKGAIEIINEVHICKKGEKVTASGVALLGKLNIKPFFFGIDVKYVYEDGCVFSSSILDLTDADLLAKFGRAVNKLTSVSLAIGYPTLSTVPHSFARAFKKALALSIATDFTFPAAQKYKDYLADPAAYAAKHGIVAAAAAPAAAAPAAAGKPAPAVKAPEPEPEEEAPADFNLFD